MCERIGEVFVLSVTTAEGLTIVSLSLPHLRTRLQLILRDCSYEEQCTRSARVLWGNEGKWVVLVLNLTCPDQHSLTLTMWYWLQSVLTSCFDA